MPQQTATTYGISTPSRIGMILIIPLPHMLQTIMTTTDSAASHQFSAALVTALGARIRPIRMMIGPVTTGGKNRITR